jgi:hypothetical protein
MGKEYKIINTPFLLSGEYPSVQAAGFTLEGITTSPTTQNLTLVKDSFKNDKNKKATKIIDNESNYGSKGKELTLETLLNRLNPSYWERFLGFFTEFKETNPTGYIFKINSTYRTFKRSAELKKQSSKNASPGKSAHNYGLAVDFNLVVPNGKTLMKSYGKEKWLATGIVDIAKKHKLGWGGNYATYKDYIHFYVKEWSPNKATKVRGAINKLYGLGNNPSLSAYIKANPNGLNPKLDINELLS